jgi:hypothetical protein
MMDNQSFRSFPAACRAYFGFKEGQGLTDFMAEIRELSPADKEEIAKGMKEHGIVITG